MKKQHFSNTLHNLYRKALRHTKYRWIVIFGTLLYLVSPLDISPDVFPVLGWIDDGLVVSLLVTEMSQILAEQIKQKRPLDREAETADAQTIAVEAVTMS
ncbi:YkvA family protein [Leptolyngbya sp. BC1307]|uniref:YkvA family protein n=1 Tax=Leptolyngbya sp. BC1307 TaxID=2029589 RepID=UPI000EFAF3AA|nr:YkvA family protein [Leptolyngbya sp. BC1307]